MSRLADPSSSNGASQSDEEGHELLEDMVAADEAKGQQQNQEDTRLIKLKIFHLQDTKWMFISQHASLSEATEKAAMLFDVPYDSTSVRLRSYSEYTNLPQDTYTGREHGSLMELQFDTHSALFLEVRSSLEDEWVEYDSSALQLLVRKYEPLPTPHFAEPAFVLQIAEDSTVEDLLGKLRLQFELHRDKCRLLHMNASGYWDTQTNILNPTNEDTNLQRFLRHLRNGSGIYVEECPSLDSRSNAKDLFETEAHLITLRVKCTDKNILARMNNPVADPIEGATWPFVVDRRKPLQFLKDQLGKLLDMPHNTFKLCRGTSERGQDLKLLDESLKNLTLLDRSTLLVAPGRPLARGEYHIEILWYQPKPQLTEPSIVLQQKQNVMVDKMRASIHQQLAAKGIQAPYLRLRDYCSGRLNNILIDGLKLSHASQLNLYENRQFAVQILSEPEVLPLDHMLYSISVFDRANFKFGPLHEIIFDYKDRQESWIDILSNKVHEATGIPVESVLFATPYQAHRVHVLDMVDISWIDPEQGRQRLTAMSLGIYGDRIVVADGSVPLKKLSKEERDGILALVDNLSDVELQSTAAW
ncbi:Ubiquitin carboxyl-terminal hydrolase 47 [Aphanomyces cochlioides]|nr:Ubiquitin carboxyl-terminal hydrolase 47 [Aphanomyces cochlioides]